MLHIWKSSLEFFSLGIFTAGKSFNTCTICQLSYNNDTTLQCGRPVIGHLDYFVNRIICNQVCLLILSPQKQQTSNPSRRSTWFGFLGPDPPKARPSEYSAVPGRGFSFGDLSRIARACALLGHMVCVSEENFMS